MNSSRDETAWLPADVSQMAWGGEPILAERDAQRAAIEDTDPDAYGEVFERVARSVLAIEASVIREHDDAPERLRALMELPPGRRELLIRNSRKFQTLALCQALIRLSNDLAKSDPQRCREVSTLATAVGDRLDADAYGSPLVHDLRAAAWAQHGDALRIVNDLRESERAFGIAEHFLSLGTGDPLELARLLEKHALLRRSQRRFPENIALAREAVTIYREMADSRMEGVALATLGVHCAFAGDLPSAIEHTHAGLQRLDPAMEPRIFCQARYNLLHMKFDQGDVEAAAAGIAEARRDFARFGEASSLLRVSWLEGKIDARLGNHAKAEAAFRAAKDGFVEMGLAYNAALISLELAILFAQLGRTAEVKELVAEMLPIFQSRDIHREALAALVLFREAVEAETVTVALAEEVRSFLEKARGNRKIRFRQA